MEMKTWFSKQHAKKIRLFGIVAVLVMAGANNAQAGFEWTPPAAHKPGPAVMAAPAMAVDVESLDGSSMMMDTLPAEPAPSVPVVSAPAVPAMANVTYEEAVGFGSDIPLVMVMRQIVPPSYSYSFDDNADQAALVSWSGGKPWNEALEDAVAPIGKSVVVSGNTVWVRSGAPMPKPAVEEKPAGMTTVNVAPVPVPAADPMPVMPMASPAPIAAAPPVMAAPQEPRPIPLSAADIAKAPAPSDITGTNYNPSYPRRVPPAMDNGYDNMAGVSPYDYDNAPMPLTPSPFAERNIAVPRAAPMAMPAPVPMAAAPVSVPEPAPVATANAQNFVPANATSAGKAQVMDPYEIRFWSAEQGDSMKKVLTDWSTVSGVALLWNSPYDYPLLKPVRMHGTFSDAISQLLITYNNVDPRPLGKLHPNLPQGPSVLVIDHYTLVTN